MIEESRIPDFLVELSAIAHHDKSESWKAKKDRINWDEDLTPIQQNAYKHMMRAALAEAFKAMKEAGFEIRQVEN